VPLVMPIRCARVRNRDLRVEEVGWYNPCIQFGGTNRLQAWGRHNVLSQPSHIRLDHVCTPDNFHQISVVLET
jgi:hypothetical protein